MGSQQQGVGNGWLHVSAILLLARFMEMSPPMCCHGILQGGIRGFSLNSAQINNSAAHWTRSGSTPILICCTYGATTSSALLMKDGDYRMGTNVVACLGPRRSAAVGAAPSALFIFLAGFIEI